MPPGGHACRHYHLRDEDDLLIHLVAATSRHQMIGWGPRMLEAMLRSGPYMAWGLGAILLVVATAPLFERLTGARPRFAIAWGLALFVPLVAAWTPHGDQPIFGTPGVERYFVRGEILPSLADLTRVSDSSVNIAMFVPLGALTALLRQRRRRWALWMLGASLCAVLEAGQYVMWGLMRTPEVADIVHGLAGLILGTVVGVGLRHVTGPASER